MAATYTFTLRSGGGTLADASVQYQGTSYDINQASPAGVGTDGLGTITTTDAALASLLRGTTRSDGATLLVESGVTDTGGAVDRQASVPWFTQGDEPTTRPYMWTVTSGGVPTGVVKYGPPTGSPVVVGSGSKSSLGSTIGAGGDSISLNGWNTTAGALASTNTSQAWLAWIMLLSQGRLRLSAAPNGQFVAATGGFTSTQVVATHLPTMVAAKWTYCILTMGTNDGIDLSATAWQTTRDNVITCVKALQAVGTIPVLTTQFPKGAPGGATTAPGAYGLTQYNTWVKQYAAANGLPLIDWFAALVDPATSGAYLTGNSIDNLHPNGVGAKKAGQAAWAVLDPIVPKSVAPLPVTNLAGANELYNLAAKAMNANGSNPLFINNTGGVATGLATQGTGTWDVATAAVVGNLQKNTYTGASYARTYTGTSTPAMTVGNRLLLVAQFECVVKTLGGTASLLVMNGDLSATVAGIGNWTEDVPNGSVVAMEFPWPSGLANNTLRIKCDAGGVVNSTASWGRLGLFDLTAQGIV